MVMRVITSRAAKRLDVPFAWLPVGRGHWHSCCGRFDLMRVDYPNDFGGFVAYDCDRPAKCYGSKADCEAWAEGRAE
jgi:hypothetical protein